MDLAFGTNVRERFYSIGRLTGLEADRMTHAVRSILVRSEETGTNAERRPLAAVPADHFAGDIDLRSFPDGKANPSPTDAVMLTDTTRLMREGKEIGHLAGVEIDPETGQIVSVVGRHHWWTPRVHLDASGLDFTVPGEIRITVKDRRD
jgi:hypothetical protein